MKKAILILVLGSLVLLPSLVYSQGFKSANKLFQDVGKKAGADTYSEVQDIVGIGLNAALSLVGLIFLILMVYAGYLWMTARGEEEQIKKAQKIITSSIIGLVVVMSAWSITFFVLNKFEKSDSGVTNVMKENTYACLKQDTTVTSEETCLGNSSWVSGKCYIADSATCTGTDAKSCEESNGACFWTSTTK